MSNQTQSTTFRRAGATALTIGLLALMLGACGGDATPTPPPGAVVVESGVTPLTPSTSGADGGTDSGTVTDAEVDPETEAGVAAEPGEGAPAPTSDGFPILDVGDEVVARGSLRIYAAAEPNTPTLDEYSAGDRFTILGPPDGVTIYPVELAGVRWYRVRAADGLVGWVIADGIEPITDAQP